MNKTSVRIFGNTYNVVSDASPVKVRKVAKYVDEKALGLARKIQEESPLNISILAALNIAFELEDEKEKNKLLKKEIERLNKEVDIYTNLWDEAKKGLIADKKNK